MKFSRFLYEKRMRILIGDIMLMILAICLLLSISSPEPVSSLSVADSSYNSTSLTWKKADNAKGYRIYRSTDNRNFEYLASTGETRFTDINIRTGTTYYYQVSARNGLKQSESEKNAATEVTPSLDKPKLKVDTSKGEVKLNYSDVDGAIGYEIIRDGKKLAQVETTEYVDETAETDKQHQYEVRAVRYKVEPVYSKPSEKTEAELHSVPNFEVRTRDESLFMEWGATDYYDTYKLYNGNELLAETSDTSYTIDEFKLSDTYDIKLVGYSSENNAQSPETGRRFQVVEEEMTTEEARQAACDWGVDIANDDSFSYGTGQTAHRCGCYFCGTNIWKKGRGYEKTYCCNPFVHACYAHGAGDPAMLSACQKGHSVGMYLDTYTRYGNWISVGKPAISDLQVGDVLVRQDHVMLYIGDGDIVHAAVETWGPDGIKVGRASSFYGKVKFVARYTGNGRGAIYKIRDVDENGNLLDENGKIIKAENDKTEDSGDDAGESGSAA